MRETSVRFTHRVLAVWLVTTAATVRFHEGIYTMRLVSLAIAVAALFLTGGSVPGAIRNIKPAATASATTGKWRMVVRITLLNGTTMRGSIEWNGLADSINWATARYFDINGKPLSSAEMFGATVVLLGAPFAGF